MNSTPKYVKLGHYRFYQVFYKFYKMGCTDSTALPPIPRSQIAAQPNYNNQNTIFYQMQTTKKPKFLNAQPLHQQTLQALWEIIKRNSLKEFAYFLETQRIPSNAEVGPPNLFWNFAHFCARWDAFECLLYVIQRVYAENRTSYMSLINQQTVEGFTPLHVAIQWNAINCFHLMLDCGGTDLSYADKANNDVFSKARLFKRDEMLMILQKFKMGNCLMVGVQADRTNGFKSFSEMALSGQIQARSLYRMTNQRMDYVIDTRNRMNRPPPPPPVQPQQASKKNYQNFGNNLRNIQQKRGQNSLGEGQQSANVYMQKLQQQKRFQEEQDRIKRQKSEQLKRNIERQKLEQQQRIKSQLNNQNIKQLKFEQAELEKIEKEKEIMRKNIQLMSIPQSSDKLKTNNQKLICPQDLKQYYQIALAKGTKFIDSEFPPQLKSIGQVQKFQFGWQSAIWLRPGQIFKGNYEVFDGITPDDIKQGSLGVCYYLALLSSLAEFPERVKKMFRFYDKQLGFYAIQLYMEGKPKTIIVDDLIPCMKATNQPLFAKPNGKQCWVMILEKAWVKMFGNYLSAQNFTPSTMFENVLPSPCSQLTIDVSKVQETFDELVQFDKKNYILVASSTIQGQGNVGGIVAKHAYSLIGAYNIDGVKIAKIRNPWGKIQYSGAFSDQSTFWSPELSKAAGFKKGQDGQFFLTPLEMHELMCIVAISHYRQKYQYSHIEITSRSDEEIYYMITVKSRGEIAMKVTQQNERFRKMQFENTRILFQIYKLGDNYDAQLIAQGEPSTSYGGVPTLYSHFKIFENYEPGKYMVRLKVYYDRAQSVSTRGTYRKFIRGTDGKNPLIVRSGTSVLSLYGPQKYFFNKIEAPQAYKYLKNAFRHQILTNPQTSERLSSVGQDLKPMVVSYSLKLKHNIIYYAVNNFPNNQITFKMKFNHKLFRNASYAFGIDKQIQNVQWVLPPNGGWNICTLQVDYSEQEIATQHQLKQDFKIIR